MNNACNFFVKNDLQIVFLKYLVNDYRIVLENCTDTLFECSLSETIRLDCVRNQDSCNTTLLCEKNHIHSGVLDNKNPKFENGVSVKNMSVSDYGQNHTVVVGDTKIRHLNVQSFCDSKNQIDVSSCKTSEEYLKKSTATSTISNLVSMTINSSQSQQAHQYQYSESAHHNKDDKVTDSNLSWITEVHLTRLSKNQLLLFDSPCATKRGKSWYKIFCV